MKHIKEETISIDKSEESMIQRSELTRELDETKAIINHIENRLKQFSANSSTTTIQQLQQQPQLIQNGSSSIIKRNYNSNNSSNVSSFTKKQPLQSNYYKSYDEQQQHKPFKQEEQFRQNTQLSFTKQRQLQNSKNKFDDDEQQQFLRNAHSSIKSINNNNHCPHKNSQSSLECLRTPNFELNTNSQLECPSKDYSYFEDNRCAKLSFEQDNRIIQEHNYDNKFQSQKSHQAPLIGRQLGSLSKAQLISYIHQLETWYNELYHLYRGEEENGIDITANSDQHKNNNNQVASSAYEDGKIKAQQNFDRAYCEVSTRRRKQKQQANINQIQLRKLSKKSFKVNKQEQENELPSQQNSSQKQLNMNNIIKKRHSQDNSIPTPTQEQSKQMKSIREKQRELLGLMQQVHSNMKQTDLDLQINDYKKELSALKQKVQAVQQKKMKMKIQTNKTKHQREKSGGASYEGFPQKLQQAHVKAFR